jgi:hypothetical protein
MEKRTQHVEETISYLDMQSELKRLQRYEELVQFLFESGTPIDLYMDGEGYLMDEQEGFDIMDEYKMFGTIKPAEYEGTDPRDYE